MVERKMYKRIIKPAFDKTFALVLLFTFSPLLILLLIVLSVHFNGKPFFVQKRVGLNEHVFLILKFRSMKDVNDGSVFNEDQLSSIGHFVRKTSLDELPQLINVLRGEMSFVGPRPLLVEYLPYYNSEEKNRHNVKPGITGLAQVKGRNRIDWEQRMKLDVFYARSVSILMDLKILVKTCIEVFRFKNSRFENSHIITFKEYASKR
ncbi:MAG: sugar transferase [Ekhidna sp.]